MEQENKTENLAGINGLAGGDLPKNDELIGERPENELTRLYDLQVYYGIHPSSTYPTYALEMTYKSHNVRKAFLIADLLNKATLDPIIEDLTKIDPFCIYSKEVIFDHAKDLKDRGQVTEATLTSIVGYTEVTSEVEEYLQDLKNYLNDNPEEGVDKSSGLSQEDSEQYTFVHLDTKEDIEKYGPEAIALRPALLQNKIILTEDGAKVNTKKLSSIIDGFREMGIFYSEGKINIKTKQMIRLSTQSSTRTKVYIYCPCRGEGLTDENAQA